MDRIPVNLVETSELMASDDYKDRFLAEWFQLKIRYEKLTSMVAAWNRGDLNFTPTCPRSTYDLQLDAMAKYMAVLEARAKMEGIAL